MEFHYEQAAFSNKPNDYKTWSIINLVVSIVLCCSCCGIISLVLSIIALTKSNNVSKYLMMGENGILPAQQASKDAKTYNIVATALLVVDSLGTIMYYIFFGFAQFSQAFQQAMSHNM
jgi:hypothetical protein